MIDCMIIGSGAAGISAALTLKALNKSFLLFGATGLSSKLGMPERVVNYPGLAEVSGEELLRAFSEQLERAQIPLLEKRVTGVYPTGGHYTVLSDKESFEGKTVILATGVEAVKPIAGEAEFLGRGVSYCATCDGALYRGKRIAAICTDKSLEGEVELLASFAEQVFLFPLYKNPQIMAKNVIELAGMPATVKGGARAEALLYGGRELEVDGVFFLKRSYPANSLVYGIQTEGESIVVNRQCETNLKGVFAAGDITGRPYQYAKAVGEGNIAAHAVFEYLRLQAAAQN